MTQVRAMAADRVSQREILRGREPTGGRCGRLAVADEQPRYERATTGSMLDPLEAVFARLLVGVLAGVFRLWAVYVLDRGGGSRRHRPPQGRGRGRSCASISARCACSCSIGTRSSL